MTLISRKRFVCHIRVTLITNVLRAIVCIFAQGCHHGVVTRITENHPIYIVHKELCLQSRPYTNPDNVEQSDARSRSSRFGHCVRKSQKSSRDFKTRLRHNYIRRKQLYSACLFSHEPAERSFDLSERTLVLTIVIAVNAAVGRALFAFSLQFSHVVDHTHV